MLRPLCVLGSAFTNSVPASAQSLSTNCNHSALGSYVMSYPIFVTNVAGSVVSIHNSYSRELCWYVDSKGGFSFQCFPYSRQSNTEMHLKIGHGHFYPHPFYLIINVYKHAATDVAKCISMSQGLEVPLRVTLVRNWVTYCHYLIR